MKRTQNVIASFVAMMLGIARCSAYYETFGSQTDLWDISQGSTITAQSSLYSGAFAARDVLGGAFGSLETGATIFQDGRPAGYVHFLEWRTASQITMGSFNLRAAQDTSPVQRGLGRFRLLAKSAGSPTFDLTLYDYTPQQPYNYVDASQWLLLSANIASVTAQDFRAEFFDLGGAFSGPRIVELDAFAAVPEPTVAALFLGGLMVSLFRKQRD